MTKKFHIGDVLSVVTSRMLSPTGIDGYKDITEHMTGVELSPMATEAMKQCGDNLISQFLKLGTPEFRASFEKFAAAIETSDDPQKTCDDWVREQGLLYGEYVEVEQFVLSGR